MKQFIIYTILICAVLGSVYFIATYKFSTKDNGYSLSKNPSETLPIKLIKEEGFVTWKKEGDKEYVRVEENELMIPNDVYVKTAAGRGYVILPDNSSIALNQNTEILVSYKKEKISITQLLGSTYHRVMSLSVGSEYEVGTPGTLAAVRGTKFGVTYDEKKKKTHVAVTENTVSVKTINRKGDSQVSGDSRAVVSGEVVTVEEVDIVGVKEEGSLTVGMKVATSSEEPLTKKKEFRMVVKSTVGRDVMKSWVDENKKIDAVFDVRTDKQKFIKEMNDRVRVELKNLSEERTKASLPLITNEESRKIILDKVLKEIRSTKEADVIKENIDVDVNPVRDPVKDPVVAKPITVDVVDTTIRSVTVPIISAPKTTLTTTSVLKVYDANKDVLSIEEQTFIDTFYAAYELHLFADDKGLVCRNILGMTAKDILVRLEAISTKAGYILPNKIELLSLAESIVSSCGDGSLMSKIRELQTKFDVVYPYSG